MITFTTTINDLSSYWVFNVYNAENDTLLYIGCERIRTIPTLRELKRHALNAINPLTQVRIELITPVASEQEGLDMVEQLRALSQPLYGRPTPRQLVQCEQTGRVYANARQAAMANGIGYVSLHQHLQGRTKQCKGLQFRYYEGE